jgi:hypothetical protein
MFVLHAVWTHNALHLWAESEEAASAAFADQPAVPSIEIEDTELVTEPVTPTQTDVITDNGEADDATATAVIVEAKIEAQLHLVRRDVAQAPG